MASERLPNAVTVSHRVMVGGAGVGVSAGVPATHSPAQILVPLTAPISLEPIGACGFAYAFGFLPAFGGALEQTHSLQIKGREARTAMFMSFPLRLLGRLLAGILR